MYTSLCPYEEVLATPSLNSSWARIAPFSSVNNELLVVVLLVPLFFRIVLHIFLFKYLSLLLGGLCLQTPCVKIKSLLSMNFEWRVVTLRLPRTRNPIFPNRKLRGISKSNILKTRHDRQNGFQIWILDRKNNIDYFFGGGGGMCIKTQWHHLISYVSQSISGKYVVFSLGNIHVLYTIQLNFERMLITYVCLSISQSIYPFACRSICKFSSCNYTFIKKHALTYFTSSERARLLLLKEAFIFLTFKFWT